MPNEDQARWLTYQRVGAPALFEGHARANQVERQGRDEHRAGDRAAGAAARGDADRSAGGATVVPAGGFQGASTAFSPASNARDRDATSRFMRERTKDELAQIIAAPIKLVDSLPGFTRDHLHTSHQDIAIRLAKAEAWRRVDRQSGKGFPVLVLVACLGVAVSAAVGLLTQVSPADILDHLRTTARAWLP
jgi:hypothetical protein